MRCSSPENPLGSSAHLLPCRVGWQVGGEAQPRLHDPRAPQLWLHADARRRLHLAGVPAGRPLASPPRPRRPFPALPLSWPKVCGSHGAWLQAGRAQALPVHQHHLGAVWVDGVAPRNREEGSASIPGVAPWAWASGLSSSVLVSYIRVEVTNIPNAISSPNVWCHCTPNHV